VVVERVIDLCVVVGMMTAFLPLVSGLVRTQAGVAAILAAPIVVLSALVVAARRPAWLMNLAQSLIGRLTRLWSGGRRIDALWHSFLDGLEVLQEGWRLVRAATFSLTAWILAGLGAWQLLTAFVPDATLEMAFFCLVVVALGIAAPSAPGSLGVWQAATVAALSVFGVDRGLALSFALVNHLANFTLTSVFGALALAREGETLAHLAQSARALTVDRGGEA
jgi:uncharacterized protein (TIRG00374 family)